MKKVKIMLTAITVFAVVGGALAFKAKSTGFHLYQCNNGLPSGSCDKIFANDTYTLDDDGTSIPSATVRDTDPTGNCAQDCPSATKVIKEQ